ncbi:ATP-dependent DNA helicase RecG [Neorickettsia findlayensis]|uniref:DEAD/DEAH box helicase n=1 Tax=Neorickettsia findlayensis TaxID=2686014 RepID=A0A6P1GA47_9RICK|nr:ATP-dependent DNA helicase RecG [Neorickettsia findlayensis]QHD65359.1 DEAD/DEAH box helicase [Neorickettsia findlayensis]
MAELFDPIDKILLLEEKMLEVVRNLVSGSRVVDLLLSKPRGFINRRNFKEVANSIDGEFVTIEAKYEGSKEHFHKFRRVRRFHKFFFKDKNGDSLEVIFFAKTHLQRKLKIGEWYLVNGRIGANAQMFHPDKILKRSELANLYAFEPKYRLSDGITNYQFSSLVDRLLKSYEPPQEWLEKTSLRRNSLISWEKAIKQLHHPSSDVEFEQACKRLAYDEILAMHLVNNSLYTRVLNQKKERIKGDGSMTALLRSRLPFSLTAGQEEVIEKIYALQGQTLRMIALLQGDVGSGKTLVVLFAMLNAVEMGKQVVLLSPTVVLAKQHFEVLQKLVPEVKPVLLIGGQIACSKEQLLQDIRSGDAKVIVATHAILAGEVPFFDLGLLVIDEQHRFGANQRTKLVRENPGVDLVLVSATPIPRTIGQVLFGSITLLNLKEKPRSRPVVTTSTVAKSKITKLIDRIKVVLGKGSKVFWICPVIEESENSSVVSVTERFRLLKKHFADEVDCVHGVLSAQKMEEKLTLFRNGKTRILLATTVVEVGVDIPDVDVIVIEDADHFGLAQLHQLRGRVGRGNKKSFCILLYDSHKITENGKKRLKILRESSDGFFIAEEDFKLRGVGDIFGVKQSGFYKFKFLDRPFEHSFFESASREAQDAIHMGRIAQYEVLIKVFFSDNNYYL